MNKYVCIHGHFYQPPRENPWLESIELQDSASPYHDWNERITLECYAPNAASRILDSERYVVNIVNNYSKISYNFGPTLLSWMEINEPETYKAIVEADVKSREYFSGHGNAIAQAYNHMILPLADSLDKRTQIIWGIEDFIYRFKRKPEGMWLPETAVDLETLDIMSEEGIRFVILSPHQASKVRKIGDKEWIDVSGGKIDPRRAYACLLPSGRHINIFFYDGIVSHDLAFGGLLNDGVGFAGRMLNIFSENPSEPQIAHIATDGESYGHHHRFGDMALAYCIYHIEKNNLAKITNYGEFLSMFPPVYEVEIFENTSWSCAHGVERWKSNCGCKIGTNPLWNQEWRAPLREALNWLRDISKKYYEKALAKYDINVWDVRNRYIKLVLNRTEKNANDFLKESLDIGNGVPKEEKVRIIKYLEMQRFAMLMFTSCGWFFDEISGIETIQILQYAARVLQLIKELENVDLEEEFLKILEKAPSNIKEYKNGRGVWERFVRPAVVNLERIIAHFGVSSLFSDYSEKNEIFCYSAELIESKKEVSGKNKLSCGKARIKSNITYEEGDFCYVFLHLGDHNIAGGVLKSDEKCSLNEIIEKIIDSFKKMDLSLTIKYIDEIFRKHKYTFWHLFRDEQRKIMNNILEHTYNEIEYFSQQIYEKYYSVLNAMKEMNMPIPKQLAVPIEYVFNSEIKKILLSDKIDFERMNQIAEEINRFSLNFEKELVGYIAEKRVNMVIEEYFKNVRRIEKLKELRNLLKTLDNIPIEKNYFKAQNLYFFYGKNILSKIENLKAKNVLNEEHLQMFKEIGDFLKVRFKDAF